jgi:eukaryotic-like serine/threonine-protein kinase
MPVYTFKDFEIDLERFELRREGEPVAIGPRAFDVLAYLIRHRERAISKHELISKVWGVVALSPAAVPTCIGEVRRALGDGGGPHGLIVTVPKRGYRFAATVRLRGEAGSGSFEALFEDGLPATGAPFVGRERELAAMAMALAEAQARRPRLIFLAGEAGIGKTRTAEEFVVRARAQGCGGIISRCHEGDGAPAFWPWEQVVRASVELCISCGRSDSMEVLLPLLAPLLPERSGRTVSDTPSLTSHNPQAPRFRLFDAVARLLERASDHQPLVIMIDDLHRADPASIQLLEFVIRELRDAEILIVGTYRDAELPTDIVAARVFASLIREPRVRVLALEGFSVQDVASYLAASNPGHVVETDLPEALHDRSGGNPFFLTQLVHLAASTEQSPGIAKAMPSNLPLTRGVRQAIARQIEGLPESTRQVLGAASVIGREFNVNELTAALALPIETVLSAMAAARDSRVVTEVLGRPRHLRFVHVLLRDALYEEIDSGKRSTLHLAIGEAIERLSGGDLDSRAAELAHHFLKAVQTGGSEGAVRYSILAARRAAAQLAFEDASRHYQAAIALLEPNDPASLPKRCDLLLALGEAELRAGERDASRVTLARVAELARSLSAADILARAALALSPGLFAIEAGVIDPLLISLLEEALKRLGPTDSSLRASVLARLAIALVWSDAEERRDALSREALAIARRVGDPTTLGLALIARHGVLWAPERLHERVEVLAELAQTATKAADSGLDHLHRVLEISLQLELGEIERLDRSLEGFAQLAQLHRDPHALWYSELYRSVRASMRGQRREADEHAHASMQLGQRARDVNSTHAFTAHVVVKHWDDGQANSVLGAVAKISETFPTLYAWRVALAVTYLESDRPADALREFESLAVRDFAPIPWNEVAAITLCLLAELCAYFEDRRRASILYEMLLPAASHFAIVGFASVFRGSIARPLGLLAGTVGRHDQAAAHFEFALQQDARVGAPPFVAQTQYDYARLLLRRGKAEDRQKAVSLVSEALDTATHLELPRLREKLLGLQSEYSLRPAAAS